MPGSRRGVRAHDERPVAPKMAPSNTGSQVASPSPAASRRSPASHVNGEPTSKRKRAGVMAGTVPRNLSPDKLSARARVGRPLMTEDQPIRHEALRVLLVEDDDGDALLFEELLRDADLEVSVTRATTVAGAEAALRGAVSCVVLDLGLPDAEGLTALRRLLDAAPQVPVLVLTGLSEGGQGLSAVAAGAQDYLVKGHVDGESLARSIRYAVERRRADQVQDQLRAAQLVAVESARLERGLLPRPLVGDERLLIATGYRPGRARTLLGGDFYDVVERDDGTLHAVVGDVCGHDPDAAALGVCLRIAWRTLVLGGRDGDDLLPTLQVVHGHERHFAWMFTTLCMVTIAADRRSVSVRRAGHPAPLLIAGGEIAKLEGARVDPPLGVLDEARWEPCRHP